MPTSDLNRRSHVFALIKTVAPSPSSSVMQILDVTTDRLVCFARRWPMDRPSLSLHHTPHRNLQLRASPALHDGTVGQSAPTPADPRSPASPPSRVSAASLHSRSKARRSTQPRSAGRGGTSPADSKSRRRRRTRERVREHIPDANRPPDLRARGSKRDEPVRTALAHARKSLIHPEAVRWVFDGPDGRAETFAISSSERRRDVRTHGASIRPGKTLPDRPPHPRAARCIGLLASDTQRPISAGS